MDLSTESVTNSPTLCIHNHVYLAKVGVYGITPVHPSSLYSELGIKLTSIPPAQLFYIFPTLLTYVHSCWIVFKVQTESWYIVVDVCENFETGSTYPSGEVIRNDFHGSKFRSNSITKSRWTLFDA